MPFDPVSLAIGLGGSLVSGIFGGAQQSAQNRAAEKQAQLQHESNLANWRFNKTSARRQYKYDKQTVAIQRANIEQNLAYQEETANQNWRYQMQIQAFDYNNQMRAYNQSLQTGLQQVNYNNLAYDFALQDTARWEQEQNIALDFEDKSTMLEFHYAQRGQALNLLQAQMERQQVGEVAQLKRLQAQMERQQVGEVAQLKLEEAYIQRQQVGEVAQLKQQQAYMENVVNPRQMAELETRQAEVNLQQIGAAAQLQQQQAYVDGLKQMGQAKAKGATGISAEKAAQAAIAETGARTASIIQEVINGQQNYALTSEAIDQNLKKGRREYGLAKKAIGQELIAGERQFSLAKKEIGQELTAGERRFLLANQAVGQELKAGERSFLLANQAIALKLEQLNDQFYLDKAQLAASRVSLKNQVAATNYQAALSKRQADLNALANIMLEPIIPPAIPQPLALPRPELQDPLEFDKKMWNDIRPKKGYVGTVNPVLAGIGAAAPGVFNAALSAWTPTISSGGGNGTTIGREIGFGANDLSGTTGSIG